MDAQREKELQERRDKEYKAYLLRNQMRDNCSLAEMVEKLESYGTEEGSPFYNKDQSRYLYDYITRAEENVPESQYELGNLYEHGWYGVPMDLSKAAEWYEKAADLGNVPAQMKIAAMYEHGWGVEPDLKKAAKWYTKAAESGDAAAQRLLGDLHYYGWWGIIENKNTALQWYLRAAEQGERHSQRKVAEIGDCKNRVYWYEKAARQGDKQAQYHLGWMYEKEAGVEQDYVKAYAWYSMAAHKGYSYAMLSLGHMYEEGLGVDKNSREAVRYYGMAARMGLSEAQFMYGVMFENGWGVDKNNSEAIYWYNKAADRGHRGAKFCLNNHTRLGTYYKTVEIKTTEMDLPTAIKDIILAMKDYADKKEDIWYESLGGIYWDVKRVEEEFFYRDEKFIIYPYAVCKTKAFFEYMMINKFEAELLKLGATNVRCTGMTD